MLSYHAASTGEAIYQNLDYVKRPEFIFLNKSIIQKDSKSIKHLIQIQILAKYKGESLLSHCASKSADIFPSNHGENKKAGQFSS